MAGDLERLAEALAVMRQGCHEVPVLALPWVHLKHPVHPVQETLLRAMDDSQPHERREGIGELIARLIAGVAHAIYVTARLAWLRLRLQSSMAALKRQPFDLVAETWRFGSIPTAGDPDFYYGDLQRRLSDRNVRLLLLWKDPRGWGWSEACAAHRTAVQARQLPLLALVPLTAPLALVWHQWRSAIRLRQMAREAVDPLVRRLARRASRECLSRRTIAPGLYYWVGRAVARTWHPKALITLYEGYGWEQVSWWGAKTVDATCRTVGYQHTILLRHSLELLQPAQANPSRIRPDIVLCTGVRTQEMLRRSHPKTVCVAFGTFRRAAGEQALGVPVPTRRTVLVLPEGILSEEQVLFNMGMRLAAQMPEVRWRFRCHPVLPFERVRSFLDDAPERFPNVEISQSESIASDFARSSVVLYRGSSAVLYAVLHGLKPVYFHDERFPDVDPLFELDSWRDRVGQLHEMRQILQDYAALTPEQVAAPWRAATAYVQGYAQPVDEPSISRFLEAAGLAAQT